VRVLVIEDDDFSRDAITDLLESWGCDVYAAATVAQAQSYVKAQLAPDVIASDYRLGDGTDGLSAIASLRALSGRDIPACLMSGDTDGGLMQAAKEAGLTLLHKPVRPAKLRSLLRHLVAAPASASNKIT
jgi:CheY-like chemotaxis protein